MDNRSEEETLLCGIPDNENSTTSIGLALLRFYGQGIGVLVIGSFGLLGNTLAIITIASMGKISLFYKLLITLAVIDVVFILSDGLLIVQSAFSLEMPLYFRLFPMLIYPAAGFSMTGSTYSCLAIAAERYFGICHPLTDFCHRKCRFYILGIVLVCLAIDSPRFLEVQTEYDESGEEAVGVRYTALRKDENYIMVYFMWYRLLTTIAVPFALMIFFNIKVLSYYKTNSMQTHNRHEKSLLVIFTCIGATFFLCHLPRAILNIYEFRLHRNQALCQSLYDTDFVLPIWVCVAYHIEKILLILNASVNFVYYCFSGREFRQHFCRAVKCGFLLKPSETLEDQRQQQMQLNTIVTAYDAQEEMDVDCLVVDEGERQVQLQVHQSAPQVKVMCVQFLGHIYGDADGVLTVL